MSLITNDVYYSGDMINTISIEVLTNISTNDPLCMLLPIHETNNLASETLQRLGNFFLSTILFQNVSIFFLNIYLNAYMSNQI